MQVWLSADVSRRLHAIATRTGLEPEQVLAQLTDRVRMDDDGALTVDPWRSTPSPHTERAPVASGRAP